MPSEMFADFLIYFMKQNGLAIAIATPAIMFLVFNNPGNWRN